VVSTSGLHRGSPFVGAWTQPTITPLGGYPATSFQNAWGPANEGIQVGDQVPDAPTMRRANQIGLGRSAREPSSALCRRHTPGKKRSARHLGGCEDAAGRTNPRLTVRRVWGSRWRWRYVRGKLLQHPHRVRLNHFRGRRSGDRAQRRRVLEFAIKHVVRPNRTRFFSVRCSDAVRRARDRVVMA
jgi:hypothetical protein